MTMGDIIQNGRRNFDYNFPKEITKMITTMAIPINTSLPDRLGWAHNDNGVFTTKSAYDHIVSKNVQHR